MMSWWCVMSICRWILVTAIISNYHIMFSALNVFSCWCWCCGICFLGTCFRVTMMSRRWENSSFRAQLILARSFASGTFFNLCCSPKHQFKFMFCPLKCIQISTQKSIAAFQKLRFAFHSIQLRWHS